MSERAVRQELYVKELRMTKLCLKELCVQELYVKELRMTKLCLKELCVQELYVKELRMTKLCLKELCVQELYVKELCVTKSCVKELCHACHAKAAWMFKSGTPATQVDTLLLSHWGLEHVQLPRNLETLVFGEEYDAWAVGSGGDGIWDSFDQSKGWKVPKRSL